MIDVFPDFFRRGSDLTDRELLKAIYERINRMPTKEDLDAAVANIATAVNDATNAIRDQTAKLAAASSLSPADVENAANRLNAIASGLESVVKAAGEPTTAPEPAPAEPEAPAPAGDTPAPASEPAA